LGAGVISDGLGKQGLKAHGLSLRKLRPRVLAYFGCFVAASVLVYVGCVALPDNRYLRFQQLNDGQLYRSQWTYERLHFDPTPIDIAIVGTSRSKFAISAPLLEHTLDRDGAPGPHVANLSNLEAGYDLVYAITKELFATKHPKILLVNIVEQADRFGHPAFKDLADRDDVYDNPLLINRDYFTDALFLAYRQLKLWLIGRDPEFFGYSATFDPSTYAGSALDTTGSEHFPDGTSIDTESPHTEQEIENLARKYWAGVHRPVLPPRLRELEFAVSRASIRKIVALARRNDCALYFYYVPMFRGPEKPLDYDFYVSLVGADHIMLEETTREGYQYYWDGRHVNRAAAELLTRRLGDRLAPLVSAEAQEGTGMEAK
jgi:hypothetical protein